MQITLDNGFSCNVDDEALDDWELLESLQEIDDGNAAGIVKVVPRLLGEEQAKALKEHLRGKNGRVSASAMIATFREIFDKVKNGKNF